MNDPAIQTKGAHGTGWAPTVRTALAFQWVVVLGSAVAARILGGTDSALSLLGGGLAVAFPNAVLAFWLTLRVRRFGLLTTAELLLGEILKLALTVAMLGLLVARMRGSLVWLALLLGVVVALKAQWLAVWVTRHR